jgi:hypothetical protein
MQIAQVFNDFDTSSTIDIEAPQAIKNGAKSEDAVDDSEGDFRMICFFRKP